MRRLIVLLAALGAASAGCAKHATAPAAGGTAPPAPILKATQPAAWAPSAPYDGDIWAQFDRPLDPRTVTPLTVFLKLDGQRVTVTVSYEGITRRIFVHPTTMLQLQRTYTVEFSTNVKGLDGAPIPPDVFFQFTTNSLRRLTYDYPAAGALEGPVACLGWGGAKGPDGNIFYEVYASPDSAAVARRSAPILQRSVFTRFLTSAAWPLGTRLWWAVTSENLTTHERMNGDLQTFRVVDASTPMDSLTIPAFDSGSNDIRNAATQYCTSISLPCGPSYNAGLHWNYTSIPPNVVFAGATMRLVFNDNYAHSFPTTQPSVWLAQNDWAACFMRAPGPPYNESSGLLANAVAVDSVRNDFTSDRLAAFFEAQYRGRTLLKGTLVRTLTNVLFGSVSASDPTKLPRTVIRFYVPPGPTAAR